MTDFTVTKLLPGEHLILVPRRPLEPADFDQIRNCLPADLRSRVLVVSELDAYILPAQLPKDTPCAAP